MKYATAALAAAALFSSANGLGIPMSPATSDDHKNYPASFPYENEAFMPDTPPGFDNEIGPDFPDVGGYCAKSLYYCNLFSYVPYGMPASLGACGHSFQRFIYVKYEVALSSLSPFNCTASNYVFQGPLKGTFGDGPSVCEPDQCCKAWYGKYFPSQDWISLQEAWDTRYAKYYCDWYVHEFYCAMLLWELCWCLWAYADGALVRANIMPCYTTFVYFVESCKTFKQIGARAIVIATELEPEGYVNDMSPQQVNTAMTLFWTLDRVCLPPSHYDPSQAKAADAAPAEGGGDAPAPAKEGDPPASTPSSTPSSSSSDSSAASTAGAPFMLFAAMASFFSVARFL